MKEKRFSLKTLAGCKRLLVLLCAIILIASFFALMLQTSWGRIKVEDIRIDARGGVIDADMYYPVGTNDRDALPCVVLSHGGGCAKDIVKGFAQEAARRGYVVICFSAYGSGLSEYPMYDETGSGIEGVNAKTQGMLDVVNFARTLKFVDQEKIVVSGHSMGGYASSHTIIEDCGYFTLNDLMLNYLNEEFGIAISAEDVNTDASEIAKANLTEDQMLAYTMKLEENTTWYNTRVKAAVPLGTATVAASTMMRPQTVVVAGNEVSRYVQSNVCCIIGTWDHNFPFMKGDMSIFEGETWPRDYYQTGDELVLDTWLQLNDSGVAKDLGKLGETTIAASNELREAIENRTVRVAMATDKVTHSGEFISAEFTSQFLTYLEQIFEYNNGDINGENAAISPDNIVWIWRELLNFVAMLSMIAAVVVLVALFTKTNYFADVVVVHCDADMAPFKNKWMPKVFTLITVIITCITCYWGNNNKFPLYKASSFFPLDTTSLGAYSYVFYTGLFLLVLVAVFAFIRKKQEGIYGLQKLGINIGFGKVMKSLFLSVIIFLLCYASLAIIEYLFMQDYRLWMCVLDEMQPYHWGMVLRYALIFLPCYFAVSCGLNYTEDNTPVKHPVRNLIVVILIASAGVFFNHFLNVIGMYISTANGGSLKIISQATLIGGLLIFVPISIYIMKRIYKLTGSIWTGAFVLSFINAWMFVSAIGCRAFYMGTTFIERFFGI